MRRLLPLLFALHAGPVLAQANLPPGFVYLHDIAPSIAQDMRYSGNNNFTGKALPGYGAPECVLRHEAALALAKVQEDLAKSNLSLKVYDCYRPGRATRAMLGWANDKAGDGPAKRFYPALRKETLFGAGYISAYSTHASGTTVDLTLVPAGAAQPPYDPAAAYGPCNSPTRAPDNSLDMGTGFDCFDPKSYTRSPAIGAQARRNRATLLAAMNKHGFKNYFREWWHFVYSGEGNAPHYDFNIVPRGRNLR